MKGFFCRLCSDLLRQESEPISIIEVIADVLKAKGLQTIRPLSRTSLKALPSRREKQRTVAAIKSEAIGVKRALRKTEQS